ncbi:MAG: hypothetical protein O9264_00960 [Leptospira sp.]|nr:hypothetical protein [Leptospira sp.]
MTIKKILIAMAALSFFAFCTPEKKEDNTPLLALLASIPGQPAGFQAVTYPGFSLAGRTISPAGKGEDKSISTGAATTGGLERKTSFSLTYTFTAADGEIRIFGAVNSELKTRGDQDSYLRITPAGLTGFVAGNAVTATSGKAKVITATIGTAKTICVDVHREVDTPDSKVKFHYLVWDKACSALTTSDRAGNNEFDAETELWTNTRATSELVTMGTREIFAGFAVKGAGFTTITTGDPLATSGSFK